ncbi:adenine-specific DNA-methyltransferase [Fibrobacter sp. UWCM]|uniref:site-specific DNA-methyltransferase n=1 Tax=Fibrobacter sp. UWCM TaxID=1896208 RepID=UPI0009161606|nr:site-specific DNA-methyltransferase [Fibrobacter sp. UWCM]SHH24312.1 adenine-specific DNA-methyltransferase [Fibrobacter sp. UWCM]
MAETLDDLKVRIRELEKEVERWKSQVKNVRYGLNWMDVPEAFDKDSEDKIPILEEVSEKAVNAEGLLAGRPPHVIIEGDNYHALTCLNYTHRGKIDVIYIDPPYNTGSDGFTYKDKRFLTEFPDGQKVPKEHPLRHSYWLSFMEKRLKLAKNLLSDKGVIFISIDDNEQANLKLLCDKVFGEGNFVAEFIWEKKKVVQNDAKFTSTNHEYILSYRKSICLQSFNLLPRTAEANARYENPDNDPKGPWTSVALTAKSGSAENIYDYTFPNGVYWKPNEGAYPRLSKDSLKKAYEENKLWFGKNGKNVPRLKKYLSEVKQGMVANSVLYCDDVGSTQLAKEQLKKTINQNIFDTPKPLGLLESLSKLVGNNNSIILDFFAGSGTTLHATLNLNKEDDGNRQCILVQQSEGDNNICENVTYERNRRVMCGYTNAKGESVEGLGGSLKYYKTGFVGKHQSKNANDADKVELAEKAGCLIALAENTLETIKVPKAAKGFWQIYSDNVEKKKRYTCIYHNGDYGKVSDFVAKIDELRAADKKSKFTVYVFSWNSPDFFENEFDDLKNIEIKAIPKPILEIYKALNG